MKNVVAFTLDRHMIVALAKEVACLRVKVPGPFFCYWILIWAGITNPARGQNVKSTIRKENIQRTFHTKRKRRWYVMLKKAASPNKQKQKRTQTVVSQLRLTAGVHAYQRTIGRRAVDKQKDKHEKKKKEK